MDPDRQKTTPSEPMRLRAFTLAELLVVLAISGIVLLGTFSCTDSAAVGTAEDGAH